MKKPVKRFSQWSPLTYRIAVTCHQLARRASDLLGRESFAADRQPEPLPHPVYAHRSLIRRRLGQVDMTLQENKAHNLALAAPHLDGLLIRPGESFSFFRLVGNCSEARGYREGLIIENGKVSQGMGGGMCQLTNLLHWMVLHTPLEITEHHHHDGYDLFPDFGRQVPFGCGTSIFYNYRDYRFSNPTGQTFQLLCRVEGEYLRGEIRSAEAVPVRYHIRAEGECFTREEGQVYRNNRIIRRAVDKRTGNLLFSQIIKVNRARVLYDTAGLVISEPVLMETGR